MNESETRAECIDPRLKASGWDINILILPLKKSQPPSR